MIMAVELHPSTCSRHRPHLSDTPAAQPQQIYALSCALEAPKFRCGQPHPYWGVGNLNSYDIGGSVLTIVACVNGCVNPIGTELAY